MTRHLEEEGVEGWRLGQWEFLEEEPSSRSYKKRLCPDRGE
jgi:hypothetical protein